MSKILSDQILIQEIENSELSRQDTISDVKYQDITYYMHNIHKTVKNEDHIHIDFLKAMSEMENLDFKCDDSFIGFVNQKTNECVQFRRKTKDDWYAEVPIRWGTGWDGYAWCCYSESKPIIDMLRLYFEEVPWFGMLSWKMMRFKH